MCPERRNIKSVSSPAQPRPVQTDNLAVDVVHHVVVGPHPDVAAGDPEDGGEDCLVRKEAGWEGKVLSDGGEILLQADRFSPGLLLTDGPQVELLLSLLAGDLTGPGHQLAELHGVVGEVPLEEVHVGLPGDVDRPHQPGQPGGEVGRAPGVSAVTQGTAS